MSHPALTSTLAHLDLSAELARELEPRVGDLMFSAPTETDVWIGRDRLAVELAHIGEGWEGEYDVDNPDDDPSRQRGLDPGAVQGLTRRARSAGVDSRFTGTILDFCLNRVQGCEITGA